MSPADRFDIPVFEELAITSFTPPSLTALQVKRRVRSVPLREAKELDFRDREDGLLVDVCQKEFLWYYRRVGFGLHALLRESIGAFCLFEWRGDAFENPQMLSLGSRNAVLTCDMHCWLGDTLVLHGNSLQSARDEDQEFDEAALPFERGQPQALELQARPQTRPARRESIIKYIKFSQEADSGATSKKVLLRDSVDMCLDGSELFVLRKVAKGLKILSFVSDNGNPSPKSEFDMTSLARQLGFSRDSQAFLFNCFFVNKKIGLLVRSKRCYNKVTFFFHTFRFRSSDLVRLRSFEYQITNRDYSQDSFERIKLINTIRLKRGWIKLLLLPDHSVVSLTIAGRWHCLQRKAFDLPSQSELHAVCFAKNRILTFFADHVTDTKLFI